MHFHRPHDVLNLVTYLNKIHLFGWYVVSCASKYKYQKDIMCSKKIGLHALTYDNHSRAKSYSPYMMINAYKNLNFDNE